MIDTMTNKPIRFRTPENVPATILRPRDQVDAVTNLLETNGIRFWADHLSVSFDGKPYVSTVPLRTGSDPERVQAVLDSVA